jgi:hypothetical protein
MWEASELLNERVVFLRRLQRCYEEFAQLLRRLSQQAPIRRDRLVLHFADLRVLQRHIKENALHHIERAVRRALHT